MISSILLFLSYLLLLVFGLVGVDVINRKLMHKEIRRKKVLAIISFLVAYILFVVSLYHILSFDGIFGGKSWFWTFALFAFIALPISVALIVVSYLVYYKNISVKVGVVLLVAMLLFSFAASNLHDFMWCAHATSFYTHTKSGGYDLEVWVNTFGMPNDYRVFGAFMTLFMVTFLFLGFKFVDSFLRKVRKRFILFGVFSLGTFLYFIDMAPYYGRLAIIGVIATFLPLSIYLFIKAFENVKW